MESVSVGPIEHAPHWPEDSPESYVSLDLSIVRQRQPGGKEVPGWSARALGLSSLNARDFTGGHLKALVSDYLQVPEASQVLKLCGLRPMEDSERLLRYGANESLVFDEEAEQLFWDGGPEPMIGDEERLDSFLVQGSVKLKVEVSVTSYPPEGSNLMVHLLGASGDVKRRFVLKGVKMSTTLLTLKRMIGKEMGVPPSGLFLLCEGIPMIDSTASCEQLGILSGMILKAVRDDLGCRFRVFIKTMTGRVLTMCVKAEDRVDALMEQISEQEGIPVDQQRLIWAGKQLENDRCFGEYGIEEEATLHLVLRLRGGMYHETSGRADLSALQELIQVRIVGNGNYRGYRTIVIDSTTEARHVVEALVKAQAQARHEREKAKREDEKERALLDKLEARKRELEKQIEGLQQKRLRRQCDVV